MGIYQIVQKYTKLCVHSGFNILFIAYNLNAMISKLRQTNLMVQNISAKIRRVLLKKILVFAEKPDNMHKLHKTTTITTITIKEKKAHCREICAQPI